MTHLFKAVFLLMTVLAAGTSGAPPNIIVVFADDLGYGDLSCHGHPSIATPALDRMAAEGQRWTDFYSAAPVCSPSRAGLLTGRYPVRTGTADGVFFEWSAEGLGPKEVTLAEQLKSAGYATACVGKWHLGHLPQYLPLNQGFDEYFGIPYSNDMRIDPNMPLADGVVLRKGITVEKLRRQENQKGGWVPLMEGGKVVEYPCDQDTLTRRYTERCIAFIKAHRDTPFFLYYASSFPHIPLHASDEFRDRSRRGLYGDVVEELDASVGRILQTLRETGLDKNTLVVFTSDNGPWLTKHVEGGSAGLLRGGKGSTWEGGMRVPAIFRWPGTIKAGVVVREPASVLDLFATFSALAGRASSAEDSRDLSPLLKGAVHALNEPFFYYQNNKVYAVRAEYWKAHFITQSGYKYETKKVHERPLLYHLGHDPGEQYDVGADHPEVLSRLQALVKEHEAGVVPVADRYETYFEDLIIPDWAKSRKPVKRVR